MKFAPHIAACGLLAAPAAAQLHEGDIAVAIDNGQIVLGANEEGVAVFPRCVFGVELSAAGQAADPGFDSDQGAFATSMTGGLNIRKALRVWENENFDTIPDHATTSMAVGWGPFFELSPPTDQLTPTDFGLGASSLGEYHHHFIFTVVGQQTPGVYLLELEFWAGTPTLSPSEPFWMVFDLSADSGSFSDAVTFVEDNLAWCTESCTADVTTTGAGQGDPAFGVPDGQVTGADIQFFVNAWITGIAVIADVTTTGASESDPAFGIPDGQVTGADIQYFVNAWIAGCP